MCGAVVPLGERREPGQLEPSQRELRGARGHRAQPASRASVGDQALEVGPDRAELRGADVERLPRRVGDRRAQRRVDEVLDGEQLVAVRAVAEDRDSPALADPVEEDLEHAQALGPDERLRAQDDHLEPTAPDAVCDPLGLDLRLAVVADPDERCVLAERVVLRDPVDRRRRDQDRPANAGLERGRERDRGAVDVDGADRLARGLDRERRRRVDEHVGAVDETGGGGRVADVAAQLLGPALQLLVVERREVERAHVVALGEQTPREVQAEEARAAGDRPSHAPRLAARGRCLQRDGRPRHGLRRRLRLDEHRGHEQDRHPDQRSRRSGSAAALRTAARPARSPAARGSGARRPRAARATRARA